MVKPELQEDLYGDGKTKIKMSKEVIIYSEPLTKEEWKDHYGKPLKLPTRYNLIDVF